MSAYQCDKCGLVYQDAELTILHADGICSHCGCDGTLQPLPPVWHVVEVEK